MTTRINPFMATGVALASAGALVVATPAIGANLDAANAAAARLSSLSTPFELLSKSQWQGFVGSSESDDEDDDHGNGYSHSDDDDDDHGGGGGFGNFIADFLANNQAQVLAVTALIPVFYLGPVAVGNSLLATAYYDGYNGSGPGLEGLVSYVTSQFGVPPTNIVEGVVLGLTSLIPQFNIGPVAVGNSLLATAYFSGYNGSATGLPGVISYVTSQLGLQTPPGGAATVSIPGAAAAAEVSSPVAARVEVSRAAMVAPAASQKGDDENDGAEAELGGGSGDTDASAASTDPKADTAAPRSSGRASAKAGSGHAKERSARSAAKSAADAG